MLPPSLLERLESALGRTVVPDRSVGGGCIANATRILVGGVPCFLKWGTGNVARSLVAESRGLQALADAGSPLFIPAVMAVGEESDDVPGFLVMEWIEEGRKGPRFWEDFGRGLAALHRHQADAYGFDEHNFIGSTPQANGWSESWVTFFRDRRIEPQAELARRNGVWQNGWDALLESLYRHLPDVIPDRPEPSILHGDLWSGNYAVSADGQAALIDPAAYYGHREADVGMTRLFGGFDARFYDAYQETWPLERGLQVRLEVYNLYHLMNHLNLFGTGYASGVLSVLKRFG